jgi:hypothetical protein
MLHSQAPVAAAAEEPAIEAAAEAPAAAAAAEEPAAAAEETPAEVVKETETAPEAPAELAAEAAPAEASKVCFNSCSDMIRYLKALLICRRMRIGRPSSLVASPLVSVISSRPSLRLRSPHPPRLTNILPRLTSLPLLPLLRTRPLRLLRSPPPSLLLLSRKPRSRHLPPSL